PAVRRRLAHRPSRGAAPPAGRSPNRSACRSSRTSAPRSGRSQRRQGRAPSEYDNDRPYHREVNWDSAYTDGWAPWDIGEPQPAFVDLAERGEFTSPVLDSGCGTGENSLMLAARGFDVTGI